MEIQERILPADIFDTLEIVALEFGGIGAGPFFKTDEDGQRIPVCAHGMAEWVGCSKRSTTKSVIEQMLWDLEISPATSDLVVHDINRQKGEFSWNRVSFEEWCKELNVVRGN